jgi:hypothetical protein
VVKEEAIKNADKGNLSVACEQLQTQARSLSYSASKAPEQVRVKIEAEVKLLKDQAEQLREGDYNRSLRKQLQNDSWIQKNSK